MDLSSHYLLEVERLGAPYRIIWTRDEGCVDRAIITPKERRSKNVSAMKLPDADAFTDYFRARCALLAPLLPPQAPSLPRSTYQMSHSEWLAILDDKHPVVDLAHSLCLPRGELKEKVSSMVAERFQIHSINHRLILRASVPAPRGLGAGALHPREQTQFACPSPHT